LLEGISEKAREHAFSNNLPITIIREGRVIKLYKDGTIEILEDIPPLSRTKSGKRLLID